MNTEDTSMTMETGAGIPDASEPASAVKVDAEESTLSESIKSAGIQALEEKLATLCAQFDDSICRIAKLEKAVLEREEVIERLTEEKSQNSLIERLRIQQEALEKRELACQALELKCTERETFLSKAWEERVDSIDRREAELALKQEKALDEMKESRRTLMHQAHLDADSLRTKLEEDAVNKFRSLRDQLIADAQKAAAMEKERIDKERENQLREFNDARIKANEALTQELDDIRENARKEIQKNQNLLQSHNDNLLNQMKIEEENHIARMKAERDSLAAERKELAERRSKLDEAEKRCEDMKMELEADRSLRSERNLRLSTREKDIDAEVERRVGEMRTSLMKEKEQANEEIVRLRDSLSSVQSMLGTFENLKRKLGNQEPDDVLRLLDEKTQILSNLRKEIAERPSKDVLVEIERLRLERNQYEEKLNESESLRTKMEGALRETNRLQFELNMIRQESQSLKDRNNLLEADNARMNADLARLSNAYVHGEERESRIRDITSNPYINPSKIPPREQSKPSELEWLDGIGKTCLDYGFKFPQRIFHAFHTALKIADWAPLTVLAGVSGTGKSQLPYLYSHFGGINFINLPVQPNWDCQESWLGFFNSIDNKFDAQPALRFLNQTQQEGDGGLKDCMNMFLLDEMNLAHVEMYFAEFLSKLEERRGKGAGDVPTLEVKLGSGIRPYEIPLGRNVLWVGTMNQDETTKSLSDKVLDRSIVINFPRPEKFERRPKTRQANQRNAGNLIPYTLWTSWQKRNTSFEAEQIRPYKSFIEELNTYLGVVGRALGHRVWQSIEYYMCNYPKVCDAQTKGDDALLKQAMNMAFEDQLVQKVMPKLRGIETRGKARTDCLDRIDAMLARTDYDLHLTEDFNLAMEFGYGQFMWGSARYILHSEKNSDAEAPEGSIPLDEKN